MHFYAPVYAEQQRTINYCLWNFRQLCTIRFTIINNNLLLKKHPQKISLYAELTFHASGIWLPWIFFRNYQQINQQTLRRAQGLMDVWAD